MKKKYTLTLVFLITLALSLNSEQQAQAQLAVNQGAAIGLTPLQLVQQVLVGSGVTVSNATFNGSAAAIVSNQVGNYTTSGAATTQLGFTGGIILASGNAVDAIGPNASGSSGAGTGTGSDPDLQLLVTPTIYDKAVLEFDFVPMSDTIKFRYVYGSEEFDEFCNSSYNDAFGFFISGPGITGPFTGSAKNIAVMPNNPANYVTINNVCDAGATYSWLNNDIYFQYDRLTYVYTAWCLVQPCQTYHIKLAVGDAGDSSFDSGVFLEENSFTSNAVSHTTGFSSGVDTIAVEGCNNAVVTFHLANPATAPVTINHTIGGTAIEGVDYLDIPNNFVIPAGQDTYTVTITPIADGITEGTETVTISYTNSVCGTNSMVVILIRNNDPLSVTTAPDVYSCSGLPVTISATVSGGITPPAYTYQWSGGAGNTASVVVDPATPTTYYVTVTDACNNSVVGDVMVTIGNPLTLTINSTQESCSGQHNGSASVIASNGFVPYNYLWSPSGATTATAPNLAAGTYYVTVTDLYGCSNTASIVVTTNPSDNPAFNYLSSTYCQTGTDPVANITGGSSGTFTASPPGLVFLNASTGQIDLSASAVNTYTITFSTNGVCPSSSTTTVTITAPPSAAFAYNGPYCQNAANPFPTLSPGAITGTFSATPSGLVFVNATTGQIDLAASVAGTYTVSNSLAAAGGCAATSATTNVTINPLPTVTVPANITVCNNEIIAATTFSSNPAGATYTWTNSNTAIGLPVSGSGNISSFTAINTGSTTIVATISVTPSLNGCSGTPSTYTITVNPTPTVSVPANITICNNSQVSATSFSSIPSGGSYSWTNSNTAIGIGASGSGNIPAFTATNTGSSPITATISVTAAVNNCQGTSSTYTITVNPTPTMTLPADITVCNNVTVPASNFASTPAGGTFGWTNSNTSIGLPGSGSGNISTFTATNSGTTPATANITVTPTVNGCVGTPASYTITVNPSPTVNVPGNMAACHGSSVSVPSFSSPTAGTTYSWTNSNTAIGLAGSGTTDIPTFIANNPGTQPVTSSITVTPEANSCVGTPSTFTITVNPLPVITFSAMPQLCHTSPAFTLAQASPAGGTYSGNGITAGMFDPVAAGIGTHVITYSYTNPVTGCSNTNTTQIVISGFLNITITPNNPFICADNTILLMANGASTFNWVPDSTLSSGSGSNIIASPANTTTYTVTGQNPDGCIGTATVTVGIYYVPELVITTLPKEGCSPLNVQFGYGPVGPIDTTSFLWNFGDLSSVDNTSTLSHPKHKYIYNGVYGVYLRAHTNDGCPVTAVDTVKAFIRPHADFYNNPEVAFSDNPEVDFIDLSNNAMGWNWDFGDPASYNNNYSDEQNPTHIYSDSGSFMVQLIVASSQSCFDTSNRRVMVYPEIIVYIPNAFTPDEDGLNETFKPVISGLDENKYEFYIYDRWGNIQFDTRDVNTGWDGKKNDKNCELGVYVYYIIYHSVTGKKYKLKGTVSLLR